MESSVIILTMGNNSQNFPVGEWRVILSDPMPGPMNMALDHAILSAVERNEVPTTLRLYSWAPPCLSLGYSQPYSDIDLSRLKSKGWDIVRRPTGGRAILHTDELTYAVIGSKADPILEGSLMQSYSRISQALREGLTSLGLSVQVHQGKAPRHFCRQYLPAPHRTIGPRQTQPQHWSRGAHRAWAASRDNGRQA